MSLLVINQIEFVDVELLVESKVKGGQYPPPSPDSFSTTLNSVSSLSIGSSVSGNLSGGKITSTTLFVMMSSSGNMPEPSVLMFDNFDS